MKTKDGLDIASVGSHWNTHDTWWCHCITNQLVHARNATCPRCGHVRPHEKDRPK